MQEFPFVGRVAETAHWLRLLKKTQASGEEQKILITGSAGMGKTRFLERMTKEARNYGFHVLLHRCQRWDRYHPLATIGALTRLFLGKPPGWTPRSIETLNKALSEKLPKTQLSNRELEVVHWLLGASLADQRSSNLDERSRKGMATALFKAILRHRPQRQPCLLIAVDDIQHSDAASKEYLLGASFGDGTILAVSAPSSSEAGISWDYEQIDLAPLEEKDADLLYQSLMGRKLPDDALAREILKVTDGSPLQIAQVLGEIPAGTGSPSHIQQLIREMKNSGPVESARNRLRTLEDSSISLAKFASLVDDRLPMAILKSIAGAGFPVKTAMRGLRRGRLAWIERHRGMQLFRFAHGTTREAAYSLMDEGERQRLHAVAAAVLKRYYARNIEKRLMSIAHHYEKAGDIENAVDAYNQAGPYLYKVGDFTAAEEAYSAIEHLSKDKKLEALVGRIWALEAQSKVDECVETARRFFESDPPAHMKAQVFADLARLHVTTGSLDKSMECARRGIELAEQCGATRELAKATMHLAFALAYTQRLDEAMERGKRSVELARQTGDDQLTGAALVAYATANMAAGNLLKGKRIYEQAAELFRKLGHNFNVAVTTMNIGTVLQALGKLDGAVKHYRQAGELFQEMGAAASLGVTRCNLAAALLDSCNYSESLSVSEEVVSLFEAAKSPSIVGHAMIVRGCCLIKMGLVEKGLSSLEEGWKLRTGEGRVYDRATVTDARVEAALLAGDTSSALIESSDFLKDASGQMSNTARYQALLARLKALVAAGRLDQAEEVATVLGKVDISHESPFIRFIGLSVQSRFHAAAGNLRKAEETLNEAVSSNLLAGENTALSYLSLGEAAARAGDIQKARRYLSKAATLLAALVKSGFRKTELDRATDLLAGLRR